MAKNERPVDPGFISTETIHTEPTETSEREIERAFEDSEPGQFTRAPAPALLLAQAAYATASAAHDRGGFVESNNQNIRSTAIINCLSAILDHLDPDNR